MYRGMFDTCFLINTHYLGPFCMATGANATPLGNIHPSLKGKSHDEKLAAIETAKRVASQLFPQENEPPAKKKRKSRWGSEDVKTILPGLPTVLPSNLTGEHQRMYLSECGFGMIQFLYV